MAIITNTTIFSEKRSDTENYVVFNFTLDTGEVLKDGPRFLPIDADLDALAVEFGQHLITGMQQ